MKNDKKTVKEKLVEAAFRIMAEEGVQGVTVRRIASLADVNVAAINYYFGIKKNIVNVIFGFLFKEMAKTFSVLDDRKKSPRERLSLFFRSYTRNLLQHQGIFKSLITEMVIKGGSNTVFIQALKKNLTKLRDTLMEATGENREPELSFKVLQAVSGLIFPLLASGNVKTLADFDFSDEKIREKYLDSLLETIINKVKSV